LDEQRAERGKAEESIHGVGESKGEESNDMVDSGDGNGVGSIHGVGESTGEERNDMVDSGDGNGVGSIHGVGESKGEERNNKADVEDRREQMMGILSHDIPVDIGVGVLLGEEASTASVSGLLQTVAVFARDEIAAADEARVASRP